MKYRILSPRSVAIAVLLVFSAIVVRTASAQCKKCIPPTWTCHSGPYAMSYLYCEDYLYFCYAYECCPGSGCDSEESALVSIGPSGLGYRSLIAATYVDLPIRGMAGIGVARGCGGLIAGIKLESDAAEALRRRTIRIVV